MPSTTSAVAPPNMTIAGPAPRRPTNPAAYCPACNPARAFARPSTPTRSRRCRKYTTSTSTPVAPSAAPRSASQPLVATCAARPTPFPLDQRVHGEQHVRTRIQDLAERQQDSRRPAPQLGAVPEQLVAEEADAGRVWCRELVQAPRGPRRSLLGLLVTGE